MAFAQRKDMKRYAKATTAFLIQIDIFGAGNLPYITGSFMRRTFIPQIYYVAVHGFTKMLANLFFAF